MFQMKDISLNLELIKNSFFEDEVKSSRETPVLRSVGSEQDLLKKTGTCPFCNSFDILLDQEEGVFVCTSCGKMCGEFFDQGQEWRNMSNDDNRKFSDPSRIGMPVNEHYKKSALSTVISGYGYDGYRRFQRYNSMEYDERSTLKNFQYIDNSCEDIASEAIKEQAKNYFKRISEDESRRGSIKHSNMAACVFFASQNRNIRQDKNKISESFNIKKKKFTKGCNYYKEVIFEKEPEQYAKMVPVNAFDEIERIGNMINLKENHINLALLIACKAQKLGIVMKNTPISIAVGSISMIANICNLDLDKKELAIKCEISDVTINKSFNLLNGYKDLFIPTKKEFEEFVNNKDQFLSS